MSKHDKILDEIKQRLKQAEDYWQDNYQRGVEDKEFVTVEGAQWGLQEVQKRKDEGKPSLEFNMIRAYCRQQINTQRQNRPQAKVVAVDNGADADKAKLIEGLIKDTEEATDAESAYDTAVENAVYGGIGFYRLITDYVSETSFNQEPKFVPVHNPHAVYIDPMSRALDGSDMTWAIVGDWVSKDDIIEQYGADSAVDFEDSPHSDWYDDSDKTMRIVEYFKIEEVKDTLWLLHDGTSDYKSKLADKLGDDEHALKAHGILSQTRPTTRKEVKWYKVSGSKVLEENSFAGQYIPIIPVYGEVTFVEEKRYIFSLVHFAKDPQRLFNYWKSTEAHILQKNQDDILVADAEGVAGYEDQWQNPSKYAAVYYNFVDESGQQRPAPFRMGAAQPPVGVLNAAESAKQGITDILNMHAPMMGGQGNETSGVAIGMRQKQSETAQFHLQDNLNKSIRHGAKILLGLYQALYTVPMVRRIVGTDGDSEQVTLFDKTAKGVIADITVGRYDVRMDTGPSFNTQREQNFALMMQLLSMNPQLFSLIGDILLQNSPLLNAKEIAERIKSSMPPQLTGEDKIDPEQAKAQIMQLDQVVQKMTGELEQLQAVVNDKDADRQLEMAKVQLQAEKDIRVAEINAASKADVEELKGVIALLTQNMGDMQAVEQIVPPEWLHADEHEQGQQDFDDNSLQNMLEHEMPNETQELPPQHEMDEPPPMPSDTIGNPAESEQGFLMPEQAQNFAPEPDQGGNSVMVNDMEQANANNGQY